MWFGKQLIDSEGSQGALAPEALCGGMPVGYILLDKARGSATVSTNLPTLLNVAETCRTLDACLSALPSAQQDSFRTWIESLAETTQDTSYTLEIFTQEQPYPSKVLQCSGHHLTAADTPNADGANNAIIWLYDLTASHHQLARSDFENNQLKDDVKRFSTILNMAPFPIWERDRALNLRYCNLKYSELVEDIETDEAQTIPDIDRKHRQLAVQAWDGDTPMQDRRHIITGGERRYFQLEEYPIANQDMMVGFGYDMAELEAMHEEIGRYISAQADFLESSTSAMAIYGPDMRLTSYNVAFANLWKLDESWLNTKPNYGEVLEALRENRMLPEQANFKQFKEHQIKQFGSLIEPEEEFLYLPDGRTLRVLAITHALGGILFAYEDVTDRLALERSHNTLIAVQKETLDNLHEGVAVFGEDAKLKLYNPVYLSMWGVPEDMAASSPHLRDIINFIRELYIFDDWNSFIENRITQIQSRKAVKYRVERRDGKVIDCSTVPLPDGATLISFIDVTDTTLVERSLRERNDALQEADKLKTEFLANVSYELRSPLTSIAGFADMLQQNYVGELSGKQREYVTSIQQASTQLMDLVNDILDLASIEAGFMQLEMAPVDVSALLSEARDAVAERTQRHHLELVLEAEAVLPKIQGDALRLKQCLVNLLSNAIRFSTDGKRIWLGANIVEDELQLYVQDEGPGIPAAELPRIFNKFYKGKNEAIAASKSKAGTGLGLSMVKNFTELHGGRVIVDTEPGKTRFTCALPLSPDN